VKHRSTLHLMSFLVRASCPHVIIAAQAVAQLDILLFGVVIGPDAGVTFMSPILKI
jgi:hypothetical protein